MEKERNLIFRLKDADRKTFKLEVDVPSGSETADYLREIQEEYGLVQSAFEWLFEGWEVNQSVSVTPLMIAATLEKEVHSYIWTGTDRKVTPSESERDENLVWADSLRKMAARICALEAKRISKIKVPLKRPGGNDH